MMLSNNIINDLTQAQPETSTAIECSILIQKHHTRTEKKHFNAQGILTSDSLHRL